MILTDEEHMRLMFVSTLHDCNELFVNKNLS